MHQVEFVLKYQDFPLIQKKSKTCDSIKVSFLLQVVMFFSMHGTTQLSTKLCENYVKGKILDYVLVVKKTYYIA